MSSVSVRCNQIRTAASIQIQNMAYLSPAKASPHPFHQLPDELWALVLSKCTWERSWHEVKALMSSRPGAARCLQSRPDLLAQMLTTRRSSTDGLELAVLQGRVDVAAVLLSEHGARAEGLPLVLALWGSKSEQQSTAMVKLLLDHGAIATCAVLCQAVRSWQPCSDGSASSNWRWAVMELLLDAGGVPFVNKALVRAARAGHDELVSLLLSRGASTAARHVAFEVAAELGFTRMLGALLGAGVGHMDVDVEVIDAALVSSAKAGHAEAVTLLLEHGADVNWGFDYALKMATYYCRANTVEVLVKHGADASRLASYHLHYPVKTRQYALLLLLAQHGAAWRAEDAVSSVGWHPNPSSEPHPAT